MTLANKHILVGICGGISAYKTAALVSTLCKEGALVRVIMTPSATRFIGAETFHGLTHHTVYTDDFNHSQDGNIRHIDLADWADVLCIAPASCNTIAKIAHGRADDLLSTTLLATTKPVVVVPAMNTNMWLNPATQDNVSVLKARGMNILGPATGTQACGHYGDGRMIEPEAIYTHLFEMFAPKLWEGLQVLVSAGATQEPWDSVRYLSNASSGKMGFALAEQACAMGAKTTLISGPVALQPPPGVHYIAVKTSAEMHTAVMAEIHKQNIFISAAAVADYRPTQTFSHKIKKDAQNITLSLEKTRDILLEVSMLKEPPFLVGFAAETESIASHAKQKLLKKNLDLIIANEVGSNTSFGFNTHFNQVSVFSRTTQTNFGPALKHTLAKSLIKHIADQYHTQNHNKSCQNHIA